MRMGLGSRIGSEAGAQHPRRANAGLTLLELIMTIAIIFVLSTAAIPVFQMTVQHRKEAELRYHLREMRTAIDRYKDDADKNLIRTEVGSENYPPDLQTLVDGVTISGGQGGIGVSASAVATASQGSASTNGGISSAAGGALSDMPNKVRYLRKIPVDPMTGKAEWGMRGVQDDPDSTSWSGHNVFDVYSESAGTATDGTKYSDW
jgi:general secretion pathway protein G